MSLPADYHMHTPLCFHARGLPTEYARNALAAGLHEIGFSEHAPMPRDDYDDWHMRLDKMDEYLSLIEQARKDHPALTIKAGLEVDYLPGMEDWIRELSERHDWDYLIGSVHYVEEGWDIDNPNKIEIWRARRTHDVWKQYFERLAMAARSGLFDIIGHPDLPKKFGFRPEEDCRPLYRDFLEAAAESGTLFELNTAGLRKECAEIYPCPEFLCMAADFGIAVTFGSDSHAPEDVGKNFTEAVELARECGIKNRCEFYKRNAGFLPL